MNDAGENRRHVGGLTARHRLLQTQSKGLSWLLLTDTVWMNKVSSISLFEQLVMKTIIKRTE